VATLTLMLIDRQESRRTLPLLALLALLWGSVFMWIEIALRGMTPTQIVFGRSVFGAAVLVLLLRLRGESLPPRHLWAPIAVAAVFANVVPFALFAIGQQTVDSGFAGILNATTPIWTLAVGYVSRVEPAVRPVRLLGLGVGLGGTVLVFGPWAEDGLVSWGAVAILGAAVSYAIAFVHTARFLVGRGSSPVALAAGQLVIATLLSAALLPITGGPIPTDLAAIAATIVLGIFGTGITLALFVTLVAAEGPSRAASVVYLLPIVALSLGAIALDEPVTPRVVTGTCLVLAGVALARQRDSLART
jgi:drug/metabolite transporter (DMT)-like permease